MKDNLIRAAITVFVAIAVITAFWIGLGVGTRPIEVAAPEPEAGEGAVYSIEIWGDTGEARIVTEQGYINQLSEHTVVVTDRSLDDVQQEIWDSMDVVESEGAK